MLEGGEMSQAIPSAVAPLTEVCWNRPGSSAGEEAQIYVPEKHLRSSSSFLQHVRNKIEHRLNPDPSFDDRSNSGNGRDEQKINSYNIHSTYIDGFFKGSFKFSNFPAVTSAAILYHRCKSQTQQQIMDAFLVNRRFCVSLWDNSYSHEVMNLIVDKIENK